MKAGKTLGVVGLLAASSLAMEGCCRFFPNDPMCFIEPPAAGCFLQPAGTVPLNFTIDATARPGFYADEDLEWKGSFSYDKDTRILTYDPGWAGGVGPYAGLWDDGPWNEGTWPTCGHEPLGSVAGDNKLGITAFMTIPTAADVTIEYGAQTKEGGWIWTDPIGSIVVPMNATTAVTADGQALPAPGTTDLRLMLDTNNLGSGFTYTAGQPVGVMSQLSYWFEDPAYDDGTHGDATAGDGTFTYTLSMNEVARIKPVSGTTVEFIWTINNVEYRTADGAGEWIGMTAQLNSAGAGWVNAPIYVAVHNMTQIEIP